MASQGWITLHRELIQKPIWLNSTPEQKTILITLLLMVNHEEKEWEWKGQKYTVQPGQMITSLNSIVEKCGKGITTQNVRTALKRFEKLEFLTNKSTKQSRLITIVNWGKYQGAESKPNKGTNNQLTIDQQRPNNQLTTNNNDNNDNNDDDIKKHLKKINSLVDKKISSSQIKRFLKFNSLADLDKLIAKIKESDYLKQNIDFNKLGKKFLRKVFEDEYKTYKETDKNSFKNFKQITDDYTSDELEEVAKRKRIETMERLGIKI